MTMITGKGYNKGDKYEDKMFQICKEKNIIPQGFVRAGAGGKNDLRVKHDGDSIAIEVKSSGADYGQKALAYVGGKWIWTKPDIVTEMYDHMDVIGMIDPDFVPKNANHQNLSQQAWKEQQKIEITQVEKAYDQQRFEKSKIALGLDVLFEYYRQKKCYYIQVDGSGFYHMHEDKFGLGTEQFDGGIYLRLRAKSIHAHQYWINGKNIKTRKEFLKKKEENKNQASFFGNVFEITECPWWYGFFAVIKADIKPTLSSFNIDANPKQKFPTFL